MDANRQDNLYYTPSTNQRSTHNCQSHHNLKHLTYETYHRVIYPKWNPAIITPKTAALRDGRVQDTWWLRKLESEETKFWVQCFTKIAPYRQMPFLWSEPIYLDNK